MAHYRSKARRAGEAWMQVRDGTEVRFWRNHRKFTQRELAYLCRCSQNTIHLIEKGELQTMSNDLALEIAKRLDVPWGKLFVAREAAGARRLTRDGSTTSRKVPA